MAFALAFANYTNYLQGTIKVEINGEQAKIYNVACIGENDGQEEKLIVKEQEKGVLVKCKALPYDAYTFYYDVETEDGVKHFSFRIVKTHTGGPIERFQYEMKLRKEEEWVAQVLLVEKDAEGEIKKIPLSEDETAYVQLGP